MYRSSAWAAEYDYLASCGIDAAAVLESGTSSEDFAAGAGTPSALIAEVPLFSRR